MGDMIMVRYADDIIVGFQHESDAHTRMAKLADDYIPKPRILHPWPSVRFAARYPR